MRHVEGGGVSMCADVPCLSLQRSSRPVRDCAIEGVKRCLIVLFVCTHGVRGTLQSQIIMQFYFTASLLRLCVRVSTCLWVVIVCCCVCTSVHIYIHLSTGAHIYVHLCIYVFACVWCYMCADTQDKKALKILSNKIFLRL